MYFTKDLGFKFFFFFFGSSQLRVIFCQKKKMQNFEQNFCKKKPPSAELIAHFIYLLLI